MAGCGCGKSTFSTRGKAEQAIRTIQQRGEQRDKTPSRAYPCPTGHGWHVTSEEGGGGGMDRFTALRRRRARRGTK